MKKVSIQTAFLGLILGVSTLAAASRERYPEARCREPQEQELAGTLVELLRPYVQTLHRPVRFFHYGTRGPDPQALPGKPAFNFNEYIDLSTEGPVELRSKRTGGVELAREYFEEMTAHYFGSLQDGDWHYGRALYAAADPMASLTWLGNPGFLLQIEVPSGTRYLNFQGQPGNQYYLKLNENESRILACTIGASMRDGVVAAKDLIRYPLVRKALRQAFARLQVGFIAAPFGQMSFVECRQTPERRLGMAVFTSPELASRLDFRLFVPDLEQEPGAEKLAAYRELLEYFEAVNCDGEVHAEFCESATIDEANLSAFYEPVASVVHGLASEFDPLRLRRGRYAAMSLPHKRRIAESIFGCSADPADADEAWPEL
jgi:hypothetical protein